MPERVWAEGSITIGCWPRSLALSPLLAVVGYFCYSLGKSVTPTPSAVSDTVKVTADVERVSETNTAKPKSFDLGSVPVTDMSIDQFFEYKACIREECRLHNFH